MKRKQYSFIICNKFQYMKPYQAMNITLQSIHVNPIFISGFITVFSLSTALPILADVKSLLDKNLSSLSVMII